MPDAFTVGSLFSGIGGFDLGLERAGMRVVWQCEQDPYCQRVLAKHWPGIPCHPDVRCLRGADLEPADVLCGGFPCQDLSSAGKQAGLHGERSGLWFEYLRVIRELRPRYVIVENVPGLKKYLGTVLGGLAEAGYDAEWDSISAADFGAPHLRRRFWLVAYAQRGELREQPGRRSGESGSGPALVAVDAVDGEARAVGYADSTGLQGHGRSFASSGQESASATGVLVRGRTALADASSVGQREPDHAPSTVTRERPREGTGRRSERGGGECGPSSWLTEPDVGGRSDGLPAWLDRHCGRGMSWEDGIPRVAHGVPHRVDRLRALGNALVPQIAEWIGRQIIDYEEHV